VLAANGPPLTGFADVDFVGSPVVADTARCGEIVVAEAKNGLLFGWSAGGVDAGPLWRVPLQAADASQPLLTQPTYSPRYDSFFVVSSSQAIRLSLDATCAPRITWATRIGDPTLYGSPVVAGDTVWLATPGVEFSGRPGALLGIDARTGQIRVRQPISGVSFAPPTAIDGMLFLGSMHGLTGGRFAAGHGAPATKLPEYTSRLPDGRVWQSREDGVYSSDDAGRHWKRIYPTYAVRVVRLSQKAGVIAVGDPAGRCNCAVQRLWTIDGGRTWRILRTVGGQFQGRGTLLYWWQGSQLYRAPWPPVGGSPGASKRIASVDGTIAAAANVPGGLVALVDRGAKTPEVVVARGDEADTVPLADPDDGVVVRSVSANGRNVVVRGRDFSLPSTDPDPTVEWRSSDGGRTWTGPE
jgi:hypothetical protein